MSFVPLTPFAQGYGGRSSLRFALRAKRRLERATGIEPAWPAWKAGTLPLSYARAVSASPARTAGPARTKLSRVRATAKRFFQQPLRLIFPSPRSSYSHEELGRSR